MNWMTVAWPMVTAACLTLGLINLRVAFGDGRRVPHLFFFLACLSVASISFLELFILRSSSLDECRRYLTWSSLPIGIMVGAVAGFVWSLFRTGRTWLAVVGVSLMLVVQAVAFATDGTALRQAVALRQVAMWGGGPVTIPHIAEGPLSVAEIVSVLLVLGFVLDASATLWRRGDKRRAIVVGGSIVFFFVVSRGHAELVDRDIVRTPYFVSFAFLAVLVAMGHELSDDVFRAARLSRDLQESERRMDLAARAATLGFWTLDFATQEIWATDTARRLFDLGPAEPVDMARFLKSLHPDDRPLVERAIAAAVAGDGDYAAEYRVLLADGGTRWIDARGRTEYDDRRRPVLMRGVLLDVTGRRRSEEELQQVRAHLAHVGRVSMMGQLASALAHELNQPLGAILRNAEAAELFMQDAEPNLGEVRAIIADIRKDDQRAGEVIDRLRALLKRRDVERKPVPVGELLEEVFALIRADAAARGVTLRISTSEDLPHVSGDRVHLQQVLLNLIINAMDALGDSPRGSRSVTVAATPIGAEGVEVAVSDTGPGVPPDKLSHVFDPFFTTKAHGMGMGLPISRTIVEAHGGEIRCTRNADGGATFLFTLPAVVPPAAMAAGDVHRNPAGTKPLAMC